MKASKLLTKPQRKESWGLYVKLKLIKRGYSFEDFCTKTIKL